MELYSSAIDGTNNVRLNGPLVPGGSVRDFVVTDDGSRVVYLPDQIGRGVA